MKPAAHSGARLGRPPALLSNALLHSRFFENAAHAPDQPCIIHRRRTYSYGDCRDKADRIADYLGQSIEPGDVVAIIADRGPGFIWAMLGAASVGAAFAVLDSAYPDGRIADLLAIARPRLVLAATDRSVEAGGWSIVSVDSILSQPRHQAMAVDAPRLYAARAGDPAYMLFTTGSTGSPKCVACHHDPLVRFVNWQAETFDLRRSDRFSLLSGLSHDPVLRDIFAPLSIGASIVIPDDRDIREPGALVKFLAASRVTISHLTPPMGQLLVSGRGGDGCLGQMRHFFWGGDQLDGALVNRVARLAPAASQTNFYGSTETPQAAAFFRCPVPTDLDRMPIGQGAADHRIELIPGDGDDPHDDSSGQIAVRSRHLSLGYVRQGRIHRQPGTVPGEDGEQVYLTGDIGRRLDDGSIVVTGRLDDQVKIRGYRVDPAEIARMLRQHPDVAEAIALPVRSDTSDWIACFVATDRLANFDEGEMARHLAGHLPSYMLPQRIFPVGSALPLLPNGKADRQALLQLAKERGPTGLATDAVGPSGHDLDRLDPKVRALIAEWSTLLQRNDVGPGSSFNDLEGDSLSYVQAYMAVEEVMGAVPEDWQDLSIQQICGAPAVKPSRFAHIESAIMLRALSMVALVALHAELSALGNGVTAALFMVSGYLLGKSEWESLFRPELARRLLNPVKSLLPITAAFSAASTILATVVLHHPFSWPSILLCADLLDFPPGVQFFRSAIIYWYLHSLLKVLLLTFAIQWLLGRYFQTGRSRILFVFGAATAFFAVRLGMPFLLSPDLAEFNPASQRLYATNPLATIPMFYLGIAISVEMAPKLRIGMFAAVVLMAALNAYSFGVTSSVYIAIGAFVILFMRTIPVPRIAARPLCQIAAASLYIYLVHTWVDQPLHAISPAFFMDSAAFPLLLTTVGVLAGIAFMHALEKFRRYRAAARPPDF